jgi:hypothetical protein
MSRLKRNDIWNTYFPWKTEGICLCCRKAKIFLFATRGNYGSWNAGHIIHQKDMGPDIYENIRPICENCNKNDKTYPTSYDYMVDGIYPPTMSREQANEGISRIKSIAIARLQNKDTMKCIGKKKNGQNCENNKKGNSLFCGIHEANGEEHLNNYGLEITESNIDMIKRRLRNFDVDEEEIQILKELLNCYLSV